MHTNFSVGERLRGAAVHVTPLKPKQSVLNYATCIYVSAKLIPKPITFIERLADP